MYTLDFKKAKGTQTPVLIQGALLSDRQTKWQTQCIPTILQLVIQQHNTAIQRMKPCLAKSNT